MHKFFVIIAAILLIFLALIVGISYWLNSSEELCWKHEASHAVDSYEKLRNITEILRAAKSTGREVINIKPGNIRIIESDPNGCSLGSNGQTILEFHFDGTNKLNKIQAYKNYITNDPHYRMELIEERVY